MTATPSIRLSDSRLTGVLRRLTVSLLLLVTLSAVVAIAPDVARQVKRADAAAFTGFTQVTAGHSFSCGVKTDQTVWCWGLNTSGQLGDGSNTNRTRPVQVSVLTGVTRVEAKENYACALKSDGIVWCWGDNSHGQLGNGSNTASNVPVQVSALTGATQVSVGYGHACALKADQTVRCWGWNILYQLGDGTTTDRTTPVTPAGLGAVSQVRAGVFSTCALLNDQTVRCWGAGNNGGLGDGNNTYSTSTKVSPTGLSGVTALSDNPGWGHECALLTGATLKCWGLNDNGQVGNGESGNIKSTPVAVTTLSNVASVSTGEYTTCAVTTSGLPYCWGWNGYGGLGDGTTSVRSVPTAVSGVTGVTQISAGYVHTCAVLTDSSVRCWGYNGYGGLGDGTTTNSSFAVTVSAPPVALSAPGSLSASATSLVAKSVDVSWGAVANASSYTVKMYNSSGASLLGTKSGISGTSTTITASTYASIADNTAYRFTVTAIGNVTDYLDSPASSQVNATTNLVAATPVISSQPSALSRTYGQSAAFTVTASVSDGGTMTYQWLRNGVAVAGASSSSYTISPLALSDAASFSVVITNTVAGGLVSTVTSSAAALTVSKAAQAALTLTSTSGTYGSPLTLTASGGSGGGALSYAVTSVGTAGCSVSAGSTLNASSPGTCTVTATRATSSNYLVESSPATTVTFSKMTQSALNVATTSGDLYTGIIVSVTGGSGTGTVTSSVSAGTANCTLTAGVVTARAVGTCTLTVTKGTDQTYLSQSDTFTLSFSKATPVQGTFASSTTGTVGTGINLSYAGGTGTGAVTYVVTSPGGAGCTVTNGVLTATTAGKCSVTVTRAGDDTYAAQTATVEFTFAESPVVPLVSTTTVVGSSTTTTVAAPPKGSSQSSTTTTSPPTTTTTVPRKVLVAPSLVNTESAAGAATIGGRTVKATTTRVNNQLVFNGGGFTVTLAGVNPDGSIIPLTSMGTLEVRRGDMFRLDAQGFAPGSSVDIWMFSRTLHLATMEVGSNGLVRSTLKVPKSVENGLHHLVMVGLEKSGKDSKFEVGMNVGVPAKQWWFSRVLLVIPITLAIGLGFWLPTSASRRRRRRA